MRRREGTVFVVDDDASVREGLEDLLSALGFEVSSFGSAADYVANHSPRVPACLILDVRLPDINGLELQSKLAGNGHPPIIFITGHGDIPSTVKAMKAGAIDFLAKPFDPAVLLAAIESALVQHRHLQAAHIELVELQRRHALLTPRERDVLPLVVRGLLNKQAAAELGISEVTLQIHRGNVMRKMSADSLAELVRMSIKLGISSPDEPPPALPSRSQRSATQLGADLS